MHGLSDEMPAPGSDSAMADVLDLLVAFENRSAPVVVMGLGYVGLALADALAAAGFPVTGYDIDQGRVDRVNAGSSPTLHPGNAAIAHMLRVGFQATHRPDCLDRARVVVICVPTPLGKGRTPDLSAAVAAARLAAGRLAPGALVVVESTLHPTGPRDILGPTLRARGLIPGQDVFIACAPEREDPGNPQHRGTAIPRVVGADDPASRRLATAFYQAAGYAVHPVSSLAAAAASKLVENSFRLVNIALANEFRTVFAGLGLNTQEIIAAAATKPFGFMPFDPGPGAGGHCIPVDPLYLAWDARRVGLDTPLIALSATLNGQAPMRVADNILGLARPRGGGTRDRCRVLVLGLAYKRNIDDIRESASVALLGALRAAGAEAWWHDPLIRECPAGLATWRVTELRAALLRRFDVAVIATDHDGPDYALVARHVGIVADARGAARRLGLDPARVAEV